jgi:CheY-like chemotaxis protein
MQIVILEDNADRCRVMQECLADRFPQYPVYCFRTAATLIEHLERSLECVIAISLDHDLEPETRGSGDPGTGRDVANYLATRAPICPIVIHTTNAFGALGMKDVLEQAGWHTYSVSPFDDTAWIPQVWFPTMRRAIVDAVAAETAPQPVSQD